MLKSNDNLVQKVHFMNEVNFWSNSMLRLNSNVTLIITKKRPIKITSKNRFTFSRTSLSWLEQKDDLPKQKQSLQPSGLVSSRSKVPSLHWSHSEPSTFGLQRHSDVSYKKIDKFALISWSYRISSIHDKCDQIWRNFATWAIFECLSSMWQKFWTYFGKNYG